MDLQKAMEDLTPEQREKARALKTPEEILAFAQEEGYTLTDSQLEAMSGGWEVPNCPNNS